MCVRVDLQQGTIDSILELEKHLKFNPWDEIGAEEIDLILERLNATFSDFEIVEKIMQPLAESSEHLRERSVERR